MKNYIADIERAVALKATEQLTRSNVITIKINRRADTKYCAFTAEKFFERAVHEELYCRY